MSSNNHIKEVGSDESFDNNKSLDNNIKILKKVS